jgi:hypothetical protein
MALKALASSRASTVLPVLVPPLGLFVFIFEFRSFGQLWNAHGRLRVLRPRHHAVMTRIRFPRHVQITIRRLSFTKPSLPERGVAGISNRTNAIEHRRFAVGLRDPVARHVLAVTIVPVKAHVYTEYIQHRRLPDLMWVLDAMPNSAMVRPSSSNRATSAGFPTVPADLIPAQP